MRPEGVAAAQRELKRLIRARTRLMAAENVDDAEDAWVDFLTHANRIYLKLRAACHGHPLDWMWWKKKMDERRDDPLLCYVHHARNSDTHGLEETTARASANAGYYLSPLPVVDKGVAYPVPKARKKDGQIADMYGELITYYASVYLGDLVTEAASRLR